jgi:tRNA A37 methylthiotransferase MiaB
MNFQSAMAFRPSFQLLEAVCAVDGIERVRFTSPTPSATATISSTPLRGYRSLSSMSICRSKAAPIAS